MAKHNLRIEIDVRNKKLILNKKSIKLEDRFVSAEILKIINSSEGMCLLHYKPNELGNVNPAPPWERAYDEGDKISKFFKQQGVLEYLRIESGEESRDEISSKTPHITIYSKPNPKCKFNFSARC